MDLFSLEVQPLPEKIVRTLIFATRIKAKSFPAHSSPPLLILIIVVDLPSKQSRKGPLKDNTDVGGLLSPNNPPKTVLKG